MPGVRKEIHKEDTNNCYGDVERQVEMESLETHWAFIRAPKRMFLRAKCVSMAGLYTQ